MTRRIVRFKRAAVLAATTSLAVTALAACGSDSGSGSDPLKVGVAGPMNTAYGDWQKGAAQVAAKLINADGGMNGQQIKLVTGDTEFNPTKAVSEFTRLVQQEKVKFLVGPSTSGETLATLPVLTQNKIASMPSAGSEEITPKSAPYAFGMLATSALQANRMVEFGAKDDSVKRVGILHDDGVLAIETAELIKDELKEAGLELAGNQTYAVAATDITPQLLSLRKSKPDLLIVQATTGQDVGRILQGLDQLSWDLPVVANTAAMSVREVKDVAGEDGLGNLSAISPSAFGACSVEDIPASTTKFIDDSLKQTKAKPGELAYFYMSYWYDGMIWLDAAVDAVKSTDGDKVAAWIEENAETKAESLPLVNRGYVMSKSNHHAYGDESITVVKPGEELAEGVYQSAECN